MNTRIHVFMQCVLVSYELCVQMFSSQRRTLCALTSASGRLQCVTRKLL